MNDRQLKRWLLAQDVSHGLVFACHGTGRPNHTLQPCTEIAESPSNVIGRRRFQLEDLG